ncbi:hypothetical protein [Aquimarina agarilytica]|uniref:hypothetical protein n=1 Tax=Aquimarina agarilytica TaxID=1087449 RepID=UPI0002895B55|nr:hypothetical protein [Aquimarina agarilytica]
MDSKALINILNTPQQLQLSDLSMLTEVIDKYPYFQSARAVQLKALKDQSSYLYNQKLKETAAYTTDREVLFHFIISKTFITPSISTTVEVTADSTEILQKNEKEATDNTFEENQEKEDAIKMTSEEALQITDPLLFEAKISKDTTEEPINSNAPLEFDEKETHSFTEWLRLATLQPIDRKDIPTTPPKKKLIESSLIDKFIKNSPKISPVNKTAPIVNLAKQSNIPTEDLMTETLAKVYLAQKNYKKAIQAYKILILKNPEKSGLFADRIRAIEKLTDNKQ